MKTNVLRGSLMAAVSIFALGYGLVPAMMPQPAAAQSAKPAVLTSKGAWSTGATYAVDDVVTLRGTTWRSKVAGNKNHLPGSTNPNNASFWEALAVGFNPRGNWSNATTYQPNELVQYQGQTWRAKATNTNVTPVVGANWELLVTKGAAGPNTGIPGGSQGGPSISFNGDSNTGIFSPSADKIALVEGGQLFLHNKGAGNTALGFTALPVNTTGDSNTALGEQALNANTSGSSNTALGRYAMVTNSTGNYNIAVGAAALQGNTSGADNIGIGVQALNSNNTGARNLAMGNSALYLNSTGADNVAIGGSAMHENLTGGKNIAIGPSALYSNQTGANNVAMGYEALTASTTADNTAIGYQALKAQDTGHSNTAVGANALTGNLSGTNNIAVGKGALQSATEGHYNIGIGNITLAAITFGGGNVAIGQQAMNFNQSGNESVAVGYAALNNALGSSNVGVGAYALTNATAGNNTALGYFAGAALAGGQSNIVIGRSAGTNMGAAGNSSILIGNDGTGVTTTTIKIGTQGTQNKAFIAGIANVTTDVDDAVAVMVNSAGQLGIQSSSRRYKYDIETMADVSAMLAKLRPVTFRFNKAQDGGQHPLQYGLIAEEVADVFPGLAVFKNGVPETVKYHLLPSFLLAGYQAQQQTIATQAAEIAALKERVAATEALEARLARLEAAMPLTTKAALQ